MPISSASLSNLQQTSLEALKTDQKTVHKQDISNLKKEIKSISNKINVLNKSCTKNSLNEIKSYFSGAQMKTLAGSIQNRKKLISQFKGQVANLKDKINSSSYKHNSSKMQSLNTLDSQLNDMNKGLNVSSSNIKSKQNMDAYHDRITSPQDKAAEAASKEKTRTLNDAFKKANPDYHSGGMIK